MVESSSHERARIKREERGAKKTAPKSDRSSRRLRRNLALAVIAAVLIAGVSIWLIALTSKSKSSPGLHDDFASCISQAGAYMYGTEWCVHCQNQKKLFGKSFSLINYIDCDRSTLACSNAGVTGYPTWIFKDGSRLSGSQSFTALSEKTGCLP
jgi:hypothetical protein